MSHVSFENGIFHQMVDDIKRHDKICCEYPGSINKAVDVVAEEALSIISRKPSAQTWMAVTDTSRPI